MVPGKRICAQSRVRSRNPICSSLLPVHYYGKPGFWPKSKDNFAPRLAVAYSPDSKTSIRAGAGIYYDHYGESLVNNFDQEGSFGISSSVTNPAGVYGIEGDAKHSPSPRFMGRNVLPNIDNGGSPQTQSYPFTAPQYNFAITWGLDNKLKTPYSETLRSLRSTRTPRRLYD